MFDITLYEDETLLGAYRQTKAVLFKPFLLAAVLVMVPSYLFYKYDLLYEYWKGLGVWSLVFLFYLAYKTFIWNLDLLLVTNKRLIKVDYTGIFSKKMFETPWPKISNIGFQASGPWSSIFRYGDLYVYIQQMPEPVLAKNLPRVSALKDLLWRVHSASVES